MNKRDNGLPKLSLVTRQRDATAFIPWRHPVIRLIILRRTRLRDSMICHLEKSVRRKLALVAIRSSEESSIGLYTLGGR